MPPDMEGVLPKCCPLLRHLEITATVANDIPFLNDIASLADLEM